jgi:hypothetical protein
VLSVSSHSFGPRSGRQRSNICARRKLLVRRRPSANSAGGCSESKEPSRAYADLSRLGHPKASPSSTRGTLRAEGGTEFLRMGQSRGSTS